MTPKIMDSYQNTVASTVKDVLNRRSGHIKDVVGEDDPYLGTVKSLYEKARKQEAGPLYDAQSSSIYKNNNESPSGIVPSSELLNEIKKEDGTGTEGKKLESKKNELKEGVPADLDNDKDKDKDDLFDDDARVISPTIPTANFEGLDYKAIHQEIKMKKSAITKKE